MSRSYFECPCPTRARTHLEFLTLLRYLSAQLNSAIGAMNKRMGAESLAGIGGGMVSKESQKKYVATLCSRQSTAPDVSLAWLLQRIYVARGNLWKLFHTLRGPWKIRTTWMPTFSFASCSLILTCPCEFSRLQSRKACVCNVPDTTRLTFSSGRAALMRMLGPRTFDDDGGEVGNFWTMIHTRPYMRVLQAMVRIAFEKGDYNKSAYVHTFTPTSSPPHAAETP